ncbi:hypothetical protein D3C75_637840 [compost metagenome]
MGNAEEMLRILDSQMEHAGSGLAQEAIEIAVLQTQIASIDDTLFMFRDLAGSYLQRGDGNLMARYREYKYKLDSLVSKFKRKTGKDLSTRLKCNR